MLDLNKLARHMQGISQHLTKEVAANRQRLERAQEMYDIARTKQTELVKQQQTWRDRLLFNAATPVEPLNTRIDLEVAPKIHTVIATDGSQIAPSHHEIAYCYLINVGRVMLHYGQSVHPLLDSLPEVFYKAEDLYVSRHWGIRTEEWMGYRRTVSEASVLAELACNWLNADVPISDANNLESISPDRSLDTKESSQANAPTLAMVDGSLIYWFLEQLPTEARDRILPPILEAWEQLRLAKVPLMGYLSATRSIESLNFLRLPACTHPAPNCMSFCANLERTPCQIFDALRDSVLWASQLKPGQRSCLWRRFSKNSRFVRSPLCLFLLRPCWHRNRSD